MAWAQGSTGTTPPAGLVRLHTSRIQTAGSLMQSDVTCFCNPTMPLRLLIKIRHLCTWAAVPVHKVPVAKSSHEEHPPDYSWAHAPPLLPLQPPGKGAAQGCELHSLRSLQPAPARPPAAAPRQRDSGCMGSRTVGSSKKIGYVAGLCALRTGVWTC